GSSPSAPPALFTSTVTGPNSAAASASRATSASDLTSQVIGVAASPCSVSDEQRSLIRSVRLAAATTWNPSRASRRAVAAPIPLDAPVTTATPAGLEPGSIDSPTPASSHAAAEGHSDLRHTHGPSGRLAREDVTDLRG